MNILFTCVGRRTYLLKYFKEQLKGEGLIVGTDMQLSAPALSVADIAEQVPSVYAENYVDVVLDICLKHNVKALICLNDLELPILSANEAQFALIGVVLIVSSQQIIDICFGPSETCFCCAGLSGIVIIPVIIFTHNYTLFANIGLVYLFRYRNKYLSTFVIHLYQRSLEIVFMINTCI